MILTGRFSNPAWVINLEGNQRGMVVLGKAMTELAKPNLYDLFQLHAQARGVQVESPAEAEIIFAVDEGITPYDIEQIMADYL